MLILLTGLPGVGKSYLARALADALDVDVIDRDAVRDSVFPARDLDYSPEQNDLASQITYRVAEYILSRNADRMLILDGRPFSLRTQVDEVVDLAARVGHQLRVIYCWAPDEVVSQRLHEDLQKTQNVAADRTIDKYRRIKARFEPLVVDHLSVNTAQPTAKMLADIMEYLELQP